EKDVHVCEVRAPALPVSNRGACDLGEWDDRVSLGDGRVLTASTLDAAGRALALFGLISSLLGRGFTLLGRGFHIDPHSEVRANRETSPEVLLRPHEALLRPHEALLRPHEALLRSHEAPFRSRRRGPLLLRPTYPGLRCLLTLSTGPPTAPST